MVSSSEISAPIAVKVDTATSTVSSSQSNPRSHGHALSLSPHSIPSELDGDGEQMDDVFSNPDTAELESRSDGTGATSPGPNSPGAGSPNPRGFLGPVTSLKAHAEGGGGGLSGAPSLILSGLGDSQTTVGASNVTRASGASVGFVAAGSRSPNPTTPQSPILIAGGTPARIGTLKEPLHRLSVSPPATSGLSPPLSSLPPANELPSDPKEASTLSTLFAHPPAAVVSVPMSPQSPLSSVRSGSVTPALPSPSAERAAALARLSRSSTRPSSPDALTRAERLASPNGAKGPSSRGRPLSASSGLSTAASGNLAAITPTGLLTVESSGSPSIFERDIEHRDAAHVLSKQEAMDVAIPSVLDDAVEAIIEDGTDQLEIVTPQAPAAPLALSSVALSVHSGASSPPPLPLQSPSPPLSSAGHLDDLPPGSIAAQIAEKLAPARGASDEVSSATLGRHSATPNRVGRAPSQGGRPVGEGGNGSSLRSRSPAGAQGLGVQQVLDRSPVRSRASASPPPSQCASSLTAAISPVGPSRLVGFGPGTNSPGGGAAALGLPSLHSAQIPTATAFPSLPLPNPYRSSSPSPAALVQHISSPSLDAGRPAPSSLSIDGAVISGSEVATAGGSLDCMADVLAASDLDESASASPYIPRSPSNFSSVPTGGSSSPLMDRSRARPVRSSSGQGQKPNLAGAGHGRSGSGNGGMHMPGGLGVFDASGSSFNPSGGYATGTAASSPSAEKKRLSFFSYADILNENRGEIIDFEGAVRQSAERDEQQHGLTTTPSHSQLISSSPSAGALFGSSIGSVTAGGVIGGSTGMSRSVSTGGAIMSPRSAAGFTVSSPGVGASAAVKSGSNTPLRGKREVLENKALSNRLESLNLATTSENAAGRAP
ncbi:hypothetical protein IE53DRAFT_367151 [Violaceomyces palustris]|uniref:Uncharacterized protein n=1 Tax=Violaceomyces palustris TaxID=1673888 RepID=A0ACD0P3B6_9BASI|nr:hypothetical protein IE53DRAFT_367151 [Violaceomyces palustris]